MWSSAAYYDDYGYGGYEYAGYEGYGEEYGEEGDLGAAVPDSSAPICWNGRACPFLATGTCQYYHPPEETGEEAGEEVPEAISVPKVDECSRGWNVLVNRGDVSSMAELTAPSVGAVATPQKAPGLRARLRSRSARRKDIERRGEKQASPEKEDLLTKAKTALADLRSKQAVRDRELIASLKADGSASIAAMKGA